MCSRASPQAQENRFRLIVQRMPQQNRSIVGTRHPREYLTTCLAPSTFRTAFIRERDPHNVRVGSIGSGKVSDGACLVS